MFNFYFLSGKSLSVIGVVRVQAVFEGGRLVLFLKAISFLHEKYFFFMSFTFRLQHAQ
jgi:hypothetical protein